MDNAKIETQARYIGNDAEKAVLTGLIPALGLVFIMRLVQWYLLRPHVVENQAIDPKVRTKFMKGQLRLWIAVLLWPCLILFLVLYFTFT